MSLLSFISNITTKLFGINNQHSLAKITPILKEYIPDLELGEGGLYRRFKQNQFGSELNSESYYYDLEMGNKNVIYEEVVINITAFEKYKNIENYLDLVSYFGSQIDKRENMYDDNALDIYPQNTIGKSVGYVLFDNLDVDDRYIDVPLNLSSNMM